VLDWTRISWLSRGYRKVAHGIDNAIHGVGNAYGKAVSMVLNYSYAMIVLFLIGLAATGFMYIHVPTGFCAAGRSELLHRGGAGAAGSLALLYDGCRQASGTDFARRSRCVRYIRVPGFSLSGGSSSNYGLIFAPLKPIDERKGKGHAASDIVARVSPKLFGVPGAIVAAFEPPAIQGLGSFWWIPV